MGRDETAEAEFILCGDAAEAMVGLPPDEVVRRNHSSPLSISNMHVAASQIRALPTELTPFSSMICKFVVNVQANSFCGKWPSFLVSLVESFDPIPFLPPRVGT
jgi:hypothetical protein